MPIGDPPRFCPSRLSSVDRSLFLHTHKKKRTALAECSKGHSAVLFALWRVILLRSYICLSTSVIACGSFMANKISLKPQVSISRLPSAIISLFAQQRISLHKNNTRKGVLYFSSSGSFVLFRYKQRICVPNSYEFLDNCP